MPIVDAFKLMRRYQDGSLGSLFINRQARLPLGVWLQAESHPTPGYALRPGWHATPKPVAPHLSMSGRVWCKVKLQDPIEHPRPECQGGKWLLAPFMLIVATLPELDAKPPQTPS